MAISLLYLAHLEREAGNLAAGVSALEQALALDPGDTTTLSLLGAYLTQAGRPGRGGGATERPRASGRNPTRRCCGRSPSRSPGWAAGRKRSRRSPAPAWLTHRTSSCSSTSARFISWPARPGPAREAFEAALAQNPDVARAHSSLAFIDAQAGSPVGVARALEKGPRARPARVRDAARPRFARLAPGRSGLGAPVPRAVRRVRPAHALRGERRPGPRPARGRAAVRHRAPRPHEDRIARMCASARDARGCARRGRGGAVPRPPPDPLAPVLQRHRGGRGAAAGRARWRAPRATTATRSWRAGCWWGRPPPSTGGRTRRTMPSSPRPPPPSRTASRSRRSCSRRCSCDRRRRRSRR